MIYVNDCSIRVVQSCIQMFLQEIFVQILHTKIILQRKKANYSNLNPNRGLCVFNMLACLILVSLVLFSAIS